MTVNLTPDSIGKVFFFEHYNDADGSKVMITDELVAFYIDTIGIVLIFKFAVPRDAFGAAANSFGGFLVGSHDTLTLVEEE